MHVGLRRGAAAGLLAAGLISVATACSTAAPRDRTALSIPSTTTTAPDTTDTTPTTSSSPTTSASVPAPTDTSTTAPGPDATTTTSTTAPPARITGTVDGPDGRPFPGAVIIDAGTLYVFHADDQGRFTIPYCRSLDQLWVSPWLIPLGTSYQAAFGKPASAGGSTTWYGPPPTAPGPTYARLDRLWPQSSAEPAPCWGPSVDVTLPPGGTVDITWLRQASSGPATPITGTVSGYYEVLPGLPYDAGVYAATGDAHGHQVMAQLAPGGVSIDTNSRVFTCSGAGVRQTSGSSWAAEVVPGQVTHATCTVP